MTIHPSSPTPPHRRRCLAATAFPSLLCPLRAAATPPRRRTNDAFLHVRVSCRRVTRAARALHAARCRGKVGDRGPRVRHCASAPLVYPAAPTLLYFRTVVLLSRCLPPPSPSHLPLVYTASHFLNPLYARQAAAVAAVSGGRPSTLPALGGDGKSSVARGGCRRAEAGLLVVCGAPATGGSSVCHGSEV